MWCQISVITPQNNLGHYILFKRKAPCLNKKMPSLYLIKNFMQSMSEKGQLQEPSVTFVFSGRPLEVKPRRQHLQQGIRARLTHTLTCFTL